MYFRQISHHVWYVRWISLFLNRILTRGKGPGGENDEWTYFANFELCWKDNELYSILHICKYNFLYPYPNILEIVVAMYHIGYILEPGSEVFGPFCTYHMGYWHILFMYISKCSKFVVTHLTNIGFEEMTKQKTSSP